jgi:lipopolysaccharide export system protein LptA
MRPITPLIIGSAVALLLCAPAHAQLGPEDGPIDWAADVVEMLDSQNLVHLKGRVNVRQGEARLAADEMRIFLKPGAEREVERIEADGSVVYVTPQQTARGDSGLYVAADEEVRLTGSVRLIRGTDTFCSNELVIQPRLNQFQAIGGGASATDPLCSGRVRGTITQVPEMRQDAASASGGAAAEPDGGENL